MEYRDNLFQKIPFYMTSTCPICGGKVERKVEEAAHYCLNEDCPAKKIEGIIQSCWKQKGDGTAEQNKPSSAKNSVKSSIIVCINANFESKAYLYTYSDGL